MWVVVIGTTIPILAAICLMLAWYLGGVSAVTAGTITQALTLSPLLITFRQRISSLWHDLTDWLFFVGRESHGRRWYRLLMASEDRHSTRMYRLFLLLRQRTHGAGQRTVVSLFELIGLILLPVYYIGGLAITNWG